MKRKVRLGRPPKAAQLRKTYRLQVLLTAAEHKGLSTLAQNEDTSVSQLVRAQIRCLLEKGEE